MTDYYDDNKDTEVKDESEELFDKGRADLVEEKGLDPIKTYMKEMGAIPRLTREQEIETAKNLGLKSADDLRSLKSKSPHRDRFEQTTIKGGDDSPKKNRHFKKKRYIGKK